MIAGGTQAALFLALAIGAGSALAFAMAPAGRRRVVAALGVAAVIAAGVVAAAPVSVLPALLLAAGGARALLSPGRPYADSMRVPAASALLLAVALLLEAAPPGPVAHRLGGALVALSFAAAAGAVPFLGPIDPGAGAESTATGWAAVVAPGIGIAFAARVLPSLPLDGGGLAAAVLVALGLVNVGWGAAGAMRASPPGRAWHLSFVADWGLVLVSVGLLLPVAGSAAYLLLVSTLVTRWPLCVWDTGRQVPVAVRPGTAGLIMGAALAGAAPFAGFPARVLLLRAAMQVYWPLALVLALGLLLWIPHGFRLGAVASEVTGGRRTALLASIVLSVAVGIYPAAILAGGGLG